MAFTRKVPEFPCYGWIHPDGRLWEADEWVHLKMAQDIVAALQLEPAVQDFGYGPVEENPDDTLYRLGFFKLYDDGDAYNSAGKPATQPQLDLLFDLALKHPRMANQIQMVLREQERNAA